MPDQMLPDAVPAAWSVRLQCSAKATPSESGIPDFSGVTLQTFFTRGAAREVAEVTKYAGLHRRIEDHNPPGRSVALLTALLPDLSEGSETRPYQRLG